MKKFFKFLGVVLVVLLILGGLGIGLIKFNDWPVYIRSPIGKLTWWDEDGKGRGNVYWKPFSEQYIAEIDQGADLYYWAAIDREAEDVTYPSKAPDRLLGLVLIAGGDLDPAPPDEELDPVSDWQYAFSRSMVTFDNGKYRCKLQF
jgi:hypothetical protein